ncbi:UDP-N-acetylmuramoyl-L-alanyl-D-glutamate--2,6-diaminopimelate ligase [Salininema proteolyticum]|uniref:UDP-N-acetylmuramoyl-L-alanyl-D-glutamate--2,6-diaminopimelate ligase n=1 Tax=Salininema proteolyticum TaxID=1607685 RepID=A0ABV8TUZ5_9ACTN
MPSIPRPETTEPYPLSGLADLIPGAAEATVSVTGVSLASKQVEPGDLYAAIPGANRHGAEFTAEAAERGAVAVLTDAAGADLVGGLLPVLTVDDPRGMTGPVAGRVYGKPGEKLNVIGITGTNGKTSTAYLVEHLLAKAGRTTGIIGTVETRIGDYTVQSKRTTPEAPELQALFAFAVERGVTDIVMEVSSHALALGRVEGTPFAVAGFTMFGTDHLDFHRDLEDYFSQKARLFDGRAKAEVVNIDDAWARRLLSDGVATYSLRDENADYFAHDLRVEGFAQHFSLSHLGDRAEAALPIPGRHNVYNAALAIALADILGIPPADSAAALSDFTGIPGRMEMVSGASPVRGVVDYAHKPEAITAVLQELKLSTPGRVFAVLGAGGDRDQHKRPLMGAAAAEGADIVIVTDDNPRTEDPARIRDQVAAAVTGVECRTIAGREAAVREAVALAGPGDTIALLGKGHETYTETAEGIVESDDRVLLAEALRDAGYPPQTAEE